MNVRCFGACISLFFAVGCSQTEPVISAFGSGELRAVLSNVPARVSNQSALNVQVSGTGIVAYRFLLSAHGGFDCLLESAYGAETPISTSIVDHIPSSLDGETVVLCVIGRTQDGTWQSAKSFTPWSFTYDVTPPRVLSIDTSSADGTLTAGAAVEIKVKFSEPVQAAVMPALALNSGASVGAVSGTGTNTLTFNYTVALDEQASPLDASSTTALSGVLSDAAGNAAVLAVPVGNATGALAATHALVVDARAPVMSAVTSVAYSSSSSGSPTISWSASDFGGTGIVGYDFAIGTTAGGTDAVGWMDVGNVTSFVRYRGFTSGTKYYPQVRARDAAGNVGAALIGTGWTQDTAAPSAPLVTDDGDVEYQGTSSPLIAWTAATDAISSIAGYEVAIGESADNDVVDWVSVGNVTSFRFVGLSLSAGHKYKASVRAIDGAGNRSSVANGDGWIYGQPLWTPDTGVLTMERDGDSLYIGGTFQTIGPRTGSGAPLDPSTMAISSSYNGASVDGGAINAVISDGSGGWYIGGSFTKVGGQARAGLAHILGTGKVDAWAPAVTGTGAEVFALASDGIRLFVGGVFAKIDGADRLNLAAFTLPISSVNVPVLDASFVFDANSTVRALVTDGSSLYVGGLFGKINSVNIRTALASITLGSNHDDQLASFAPTFAGGAVAVYALALNGSMLYAGGSFTFVNSISHPYLAGFNVSLGSLVAITNLSANSLVNALAVDSSSGSTVLYAGGTFSTLAGSSRSRVGGMTIDLSAGTATVTSFTASVSEDVKALAFKGTSLYIGGALTTVAGSSQPGAVVYDFSGGPTGSAAVNQPKVILGSTAGSINAFGVSAGSDVYFGGSLSSVGGSARPYFAKLSLLTGKPVAWGWSPFTSSVRIIKKIGTWLYVGGDFSSPAGRLGGFNLADGTTSWDGKANDVINAIDADDLNLYVGGSFTTIDNGTVRTRLASFALTNHVLQGWLSTYGADGPISVIRVANGKTYIGGSFSKINNVTANDFGVVGNSDLSVATHSEWTHVTGSKVADFIFSGSDLLLAGNFTMSSGSRSLGKLSSATLTGSSWANLGTGTIATLIQRDSAFYFGGVFSTIGSTVVTGAGAVDAGGVLQSTWTPLVGTYTLTPITRLMNLGSGILVGGGFGTFQGLGYSSLVVVDPVTAMPLY